MIRIAPPDLANSMKVKPSNLDGPLERALRELEAN
jgi:hypothetical protein